MSKDRPIKQVVPDDRIQKAPALPTDRPPTRREVWERFHALYFDFKSHRKTPLCFDRCNHRSPGELEAFCREAWVWYYVSAFNFQEWRKQPEWVEGDPIIPEAIPDEPFYSGESAKWSKTLYALVGQADAIKPTLNEQQLGLEAA